MGIPFYYKTLINKHNGVVSSINANSKIECDRLFFDFNSIIHQSSQWVIKNVTDLEMKGQSLEKLIFNKITETVDMIVKIIKPRNLVYIAIDGVCPRAKMHQQQKRRYMNAWKAEQLGIDNSKWDSNCITPGTNFMKHLDKHLTEYVHAKNNNWKLSGSNEAGEGEHKIFKFINETPEREHKYNDLIYGLDADLIILSLISKNAHNITLLRDENENELNSFNVLSIKALADSIHNEYQISIEEYVFLCSLLGNDFLPPLSYMSIKNDDIDHVISVYKSLMQEGIPGIMSQGAINHLTLITLFSKLSESEDIRFRTAHALYHKNTRNIKSLSNDEKINVYPILNKFPQKLINPEQNGWRLSYYQYLFPAPIDNTHVCDKYIEGLYWIVEYYFHYDKASKTWFYPFNYSPCILDVYNRLASEPNFDRIYTNVINTESYYQVMLKQPLIQLLLVLPPHSYKVLPCEKAQSLMLKLDSRCLHFYPRRFSINTYLKTYIWECYPNIPTVSVDEIMMALNS